MNSCLKCSAVLLMIFGIFILLDNGMTGAEDKSRQIDTSVLSAALKEVIEKNLDALNQEDMEKCLATMHTKSPAYDATKTMMKTLFNTYDCTMKLLEFEFVTLNKEYAIVRVKQETKKVNGPDFNNNNVDAYHILRREDEKWKLWQTTILEIEFIK